MIQKIDINEVERNLPSTNIVDSLRGLKGMDSVLINPDTLLASSIALISIPFSNGDDLNKLERNGLYGTTATAIVDSLVNKPSGGKDGECIMLLFKSGKYGVQIYFNVSSELMFVRYIHGNSWGVWKSVTLT